MQVWSPQHRLVRSSFARSVALLVSGAALAYGVTALVAPILSRVYTPADFGLLALFTSVVSILAEAASWRYEMAIVLPREEHDAIDLLALSSWIVLAMSVGALGCVAIAGRPLAHLLKSPQLAEFLWWLPLALFALGISQAFSLWATRRKGFRLISISQVTRALGAALVQSAAGFLHAGAAGLVGGRIAGDGTAALTLGAQILHADRGLWRRLLKPDPTHLKRLAREFSDFPKFSLPQGLINALSQSVPAFVLAGFYDPQAVGLYAMGHRLLYLPSRFVGQSVRQVFLQRASEARAHGGDLPRLLVRTTLGLFAIGLLPALLIIVAGPQLFTFALGAEWTRAGQYAQWMVLWLFFLFVNPPAVVLTQVLRIQHLLLIFDCALLVCRAAALIVGGIYFDALTSVALFSIVGAVFNLALIVGMLIYCRRLKGRSPASLDTRGA